jgi:hypothetical protein
MRSLDKSVDDQWPDEAKPLELAGQSGQLV